jgi:hypothetical protein
MFEVVTYRPASGFPQGRGNIPSRFFLPGILTQGPHHWNCHCGKNTDYGDCN